MIGRMEYLVYIVPSFGSTSMVRHVKPNPNPNPNSNLMILKKFPPCCNGQYVGQKSLPPTIFRRSYFPVFFLVTTAVSRDAENTWCPTMGTMTIFFHQFCNNY